MPRHPRSGQHPDSLLIISLETLSSPRILLPFDVISRIVRRAVFCGTLQLSSILVELLQSGVTFGVLLPLLNEARQLYIYKRYSIARRYSYLVQGTSFSRLYSLPSEYYRRTTSSISPRVQSILGLIYISTISLRTRSSNYARLSRFLQAISSSVGFQISIVQLDMYKLRLSVSITLLIASLRSKYLVDYTQRSQIQETVYSVGSYSFFLRLSIALVYTATPIVH